MDPSHSVEFTRSVCPPPEEGVHLSFQDKGLYAQKFEEISENHTHKSTNADKALKS